MTEEEPNFRDPWMHFVISEMLDLTTDKVSESSTTEIAERDLPLTFLPCLFCVRLKVRSDARVRSFSSVD
jgi:hypothetical protein